REQRSAATIFVDVTFGMRKDAAANALTRAHASFAKYGYRVVDVTDYTENGDLQGLFATYQRPEPAPQPPSPAPAPTPGADHPRPRQPRQVRLPRGRRDRLHRKRRPAGFLRHLPAPRPRSAPLLVRTRTNARRRPRGCAPAAVLGRLRQQTIRGTTRVPGWRP